MIRLLIASDAEERWNSIASRLKGAEIAACLDVSRCLDALEACHAVVFIDPHSVEKNVIETMLHAGKHVLYAAEPSLSWADWESLWETARRSQAQLAVVNPDRYLSSRQLIKRQLPDPLGQAGLVRIHRWEPAASNVSQSPVSPGPMLRDLDMVLWLVGKSPDCIYAIEHGMNDANAAERRCAQIHLGFPGGGMALLNYDNRLPPGDAYHSLSVIGSDGAAYADDHQNMQIVFRGGHPQAVRTEEGVKALAEMVQSFVDTLHGRPDSTKNISAWRDVFTVADAVRQSLTARCAVHREGRCQ